MTQSENELNAVLGSRICHDLINPLGAITSGIELLEMSGHLSPELSLISDSAQSAAWRIRYFRIAFGVASPQQSISAREFSEILEAASKWGRVRYQWLGRDEISRAKARLLLLLGLCLEHAMPWGGQITIDQDSSSQIFGEAKSFNEDPTAWAILSAVSNDAEIEPATVQFDMARRAASDLDIRLVATRTEKVLAINF